MYHRLDMRARFMLPVLLLLISVALPHAGGAQAPMSAFLNARAYFPMPEGATIVVETLDDTDFNIGVATALTQSLAARGLGGPAPGRLTLSFETLDQFPNVRRDDAVGELYIDTLLGASLRLNMWSSRGASLFNPGDGNQAASGQFVILAILFDNQEKRRVWEAEVSVPVRARDNDADTRRVVHLLAKHVGETIRNQRFDL